MKNVKVNVQETRFIETSQKMFIGSRLHNWKNKLCIDTCLDSPFDVQDKSTATHFEHK